MTGKIRDFTVGSTVEVTSLAMGMPQRWLGRIGTVLAVAPPVLKVGFGSSIQVFFPHELTIIRGGTGG